MLLILNLEYEFEINDLNSHVEFKGGRCLNYYSSTKIFIMNTPKWNQFSIKRAAHPGLYTYVLGMSPNYFKLKPKMNKYLQVSRYSSRSYKLIYFQL